MRSRPLVSPPAASSGHFGVPPLDVRRRAIGPARTPRMPRGSSACDGPTTSAGGSVRSRPLVSPPAASSGISACRRSMCDAAPSAPFARRVYCGALVRAMRPTAPEFRPHQAARLSASGIEWADSGLTAAPQLALPEKNENDRTPPATHTTAFKTTTRVQQLCRHCSTTLTPSGPGRERRDTGHWALGSTRTPPKKWVCYLVC